MKWLAFAMTLLLAGCLSSTDTTETKTSAATPPAFRFSEPVLVSTAGKGYEPSLDVAPDGTLYATAARSVGASTPAGPASWVWTSRDNGTTWTELTSPGDVQKRFFGFEGDTAVDGEGRLYFADTSLAEIMLSRWSPTPEGPRWDYTKPMLTTHLDDRPWLVAGGNGIVYYLGNGVRETPSPGDVTAGTAPLRAFHIYVSTDGGETWSLGHALSNGFSGLAIDPADPNHALVVSYGGIEAYATRDTGKTWNASKVATQVAAYGMQFPAAAIDMGGNEYAAWIDGRPAAEGADTLHVAQNAPPWRELMVPNPGPSLAYVWAAGGPNGTLAVAYQYSNDTPTRSGSTWYAGISITRNAWADEPTWETVLLDATPICTCIDGTPDFMQIQFDTSGRLHAIYSRHAADDPMHPQNRIAGDIYYVRQV